MEAVLHAAVEAGVNYVDLLYNGSRFWDDFGPAIRGYRDKVVVAAHWGSGQENDQPANVRDLADCARFFDDTLSRLGNGYADVGMLMMIDTEELWDTWGVASLEQLARYKAQGHIGAIGMSGHKADVALKAVESGQIDVLMYPVNMAAHAVEGNDALYQACARQGVGLVGMKPYAGGGFFLPGESVLLHWYRAGGECLEVEKVGTITPAQCLHYVLDLPVATVVPGVKNVEELAAALHYWEASEAERDYRSLIAHVHHRPIGQCVYCNHCLPCPQSIDIGQTIRLVDVAAGGVTDGLLSEYAALAVKASACVECNACLWRCPFEVYIVGKMREAVELFEGDVA
jgi:predicted aldo/keto reductase-like oxidoreductase